VSESPALRHELDVQRGKVDVDYFDITVRELVRMAGEGELHRAPEYQRKFRWDEETESRLIESIFLGLPVPSLFVATNADGTWEVVDGLQRLSTLLHFVAEPLELLAEMDKSTPLTLQGLEKVPSLNKLSYAELPGPLQLTFTRRPIRVTALSDKSDYEARYDMFDRLNRGGVALTAQEVRACVFQGPFNDLIRTLSESASFKQLVKVQKTHEDDATKEELVLKFFAYLNDQGRFSGAVREFLDRYMRENVKSFDVEGGMSLFERVVGRLVEITGGRPLLRRGYGVTPLNQLEAVMVGAARVLEGGGAIGKPPDDWMNDPELVQASTKGTNTPAMLQRRIARAEQLLS
jgi:hypothetical protein